MKVDWLIIGAGPAGLQLGYLLQKSNMDYLILERNAIAGSFFQEFPRHQQLLSHNKVFTGTSDAKLNLRWDEHSLLTEEDFPAFNTFSREYFPRREEIVNYLNAFTDAHHLKIKFGATVSRVEKKDHVFDVVLETGDCFECNKLFIATGTSQPYLPEIPGIEFTSNYCDVSTNKEEYIDKRVLIIGKGNSALEIANGLLSVTRLTHIVSANPIRMAWRTHYSGDLHAANHVFLESDAFKLQNAVLNAEILDIQFDSQKYLVTFAYTLARGEIETLEYDIVITCAGFQFDNTIFANNTMPALGINNRFPLQTSYYESVNIPDLYFIGTLMQERDFRQKHSAFIQGFRYNIDFLFKYLTKSNYPYHVIANDIRALADFIMRRINHSSGLWHQTGYLADIIVYRARENQFNYYCEIPQDFAHSWSLIQNNHYLVITLEYGQKRIRQYRNVFAIERIHKEDYANARMSISIHPIIRHYYHQKLVSEHHIIEDLDNIWDESVHIQPLIDYLINQLAPIRMEQAIQHTESHL